ncbi:unnamed protein product, partial [Urochloa humidicola]
TDTSIHIAASYAAGPLPVDLSVAQKKKKKDDLSVRCRPGEHAAATGGVGSMPAASEGRGGDEVQGRHTAAVDGRGMAGGVRTRSSGGGKAPASTSREAAGGAAQATGGGGRKPPARSSPSMAKKRKIDGVDPAPSPRRMTRASTKLQKDDGPKPSQRRTRDHDILMVRDSLTSLDMMN